MLYLLNNTTLFDRCLVCTQFFLTLPSIYKEQALSVTLWVHVTDVCMCLWKNKRHTFPTPSLKGSEVLTRCSKCRKSKCRISIVLLCAFMTACECVCLHVLCVCVCVCV